MENEMENIRPAAAEDASRIAELVVFNYRVNFYPFFKNDEFYFKELNVLELAKEYAEGSEALGCCYVYDDGAVKGFVRVKGQEIEKLFVEPQFQGMNIGGRLLEFAAGSLGADWLWVLKYNRRGISFYRRHGFELTGEEIIEDEWVPLLKMRRAR